ncbi:MAG: ImmA/IrrE family metallo-endopeptidase [Nannocystis sp.]|nr:ImmA/IrrE family metallo-endopeptidase [Nannocystis sp.]
MLVWARRRAGVSKAEVASRLLGGNTSRLSAWETGSDQPTFEQARKLAALFRVPLPYFFFSDPPPEEAQPIPDLRTVGDHARPISLALRDVVRDARRKQDWLRDVRLAEDVPALSFVGACSPEDVPKAVEVLREFLGPPDEVRRRVSSEDEYLRLLCRNAEAAGVLVLRSSVVDNNNHRPIDVDDFRGFALVDTHAPVVFINTRDAPVAQVFTLLHELAHIVAGITGVSNSPVASATKTHQRSEEISCNKIAAEFLVPEREFRQQWDTRGVFAEKVDKLRRHFRVSRLVVARRALDLGFVGQALFWEYARPVLDKATSDRSKSEGGPAFSVLVRARNGQLFTRQVVSAARSGQLQYRDAATLLNIRPKHVDDLAVKMMVEE